MNILFAKSCMATSSRKLLPPLHVFFGHQTAPYCRHFAKGSEHGLLAKVRHQPVPSSFFGRRVHANGKVYVYISLGFKDSGYGRILCS